MADEKIKNTPRRLLSAIRNGDYAHPGEEEAIELILKELDALITLPPENINVLDAGCGLGGTANYIQLKKHYHVSGIDLDATSIEHASKHYPNVSFTHDNILNILNHYSPQQFNITYLFNVLYAFSNKTEVLHLLASIAKPGGLLIISDYCTTDKTNIHLLDLADKPMHPIALSGIEKTLNDASWKLVKLIDLDDHYRRWYSGFLEKLKTSKPVILKTFTLDVYEKVEKAFTDILNKLNSGGLGGGIIFAIK
ncbi:MAG TPA: class I SAM-dependent methyltransferase [Gammaproteobacteria bacterium]|nr:class I SAM-dependent methyltransferase [Gammaproteobacteria bacterium]